MDTQASQPPKAANDADFAEYNRLAVQMEGFHNYFRVQWRTLYTAASSGQRPSNLSIRQYLKLGLDFCHSLTNHHNIEETFIFPRLARKMPAFQDSHLMKLQHKGIHDGLELFEKYLNDCLAGESELRMREVKGILDTFGATLWAHLGDEVKELGAENMKKYWTKAEMNALMF